MQKNTIYKICLQRLATVLLCFTCHCHAADRLVHRWTDAQGRVHYGDANAASGQRNAKPVRVQQPISVVHNDHPTPPSSISSPTPVRRAATRRKADSVPRSAPRPNCNAMREQLSGHRATADAFRQMQQQYDEQCIKGHYYGDSTS